MSKMRSKEIPGSDGMSIVIYYPTDRTIHFEDGTMLILPPSDPDVEWEAAFDDDDPSVLEDLIEKRLLDNA